jgi:hypothetical protein
MAISTLVVALEKGITTISPDDCRLPDMLNLPLGVINRVISDHYAYAQRLLVNEVGILRLAALRMLATLSEELVC